MINESIHEEVLRVLVQQNVVRECLVAKIDGASHWSLSIRLGGNCARWVPVRSRR